MRCIGQTGSTAPGTIGGHPQSPLLADPEALLRERTTSCKGMNMVRRYGWDSNGACLVNAAPYGY